MIRNIEDEKFRDQLLGTVVNSVNERRLVDEIMQQGIQDDNYHRALQEIDKVREFIGTPENILGNEYTKHGEIAEQVEVGVRRARQALEGSNLTATFEGVGRTAPEDYIIDGIKVQSKFINGTNNNLNSVLEHMDKYSNFGRDGSYYHIPKNEYGLIEKIRNNENIDGLSLNTIHSIKNKIVRIEIESGKSFEEVVKPGISTYPEVQQGKIHQTLENKTEEINQRNTEKKNQISDDHQANLGEALKVTGIAAAVGATVSLTTSLYKKGKEGKKFYKGEFSSSDWEEVGINTVKGGFIGGVSGATIYGLTNYASLSAPFAGAIVSATKGVGSLATDFNNGKIDRTEFLELGMVVCSESAIVGLATAAGQTIIPIPVLGAVIGSLAGTILANSLGAGNKITAKMIRDDMKEYLDILDAKYKKIVEEIVTEFEKLGNLTDAAFNAANNEKAFYLSIALAREYGVKEDSILVSTKDIDSFMLK